LLRAFITVTVPQFVERTCRYASHTPHRRFAYTTTTGLHRSALPFHTAHVLFTPPLPLRTLFYTAVHVCVYVVRSVLRTFVLVLRFALPFLVYSAFAAHFLTFAFSAFRVQALRDRSYVRSVRSLIVLIPQRSFYSFVGCTYGLGLFAFCLRSVATALRLHCVFNHVLRLRFHRTACHPFHAFTVLVTVFALRDRTLWCRLCWMRITFVYLLPFPFRSAFCAFSLRTVARLSLH